MIWRSAHLAEAAVWALPTWRPGWTERIPGPAAIARLSRNKWCYCWSWRDPGHSWVSDSTAGPFFLQSGGQTWGHSVLLQWIKDSTWLNNHLHCQDTGLVRMDSISLKTSKLNCHLCGGFNGSSHHLRTSQVDQHPSWCFDLWMRSTMWCDSTTTQQCYETLP